MKNSILTLILVLTCISPSLLNANILYVPGSYPTIQSAINSAVNGDTIFVAPGIYYENVNFRGKGILLASYYLTNHDTSYISNTVINGSTPVHSDTASCVIMTKPNISSASDTTAGLFGFTLTGGRGLVWYDIHYPGHYFREGGGIFIQFWSPRIRFNRIIANNIRDTLHPDGGGGGIRCCDGNPLIENNVIQYNYGYCGTAINFYYASGTIRNNIIAGNYGGSVWGGGAIYTYDNHAGKPTFIENNTVVNNTSSTGCGGLRIYLSNSVTIKNNIIWGNLPVQNFVSGGTVTITYCDVQGGWSGTGNINLYPQFINNTFCLNSASPCIDAGDNGVIYNDPENPQNPGYALLPALGTVRNDMGVFGGPHCAVIGSTTIGIKEIRNKSIITDFKLYQNYPNPYNPVTKIKFDIPENFKFKISNLKLVVYDILGKEIETLVNETLQRGTYEVTFDGSNLPSGIYFYRIVAGDFTAVKSMVLIK